MNNEKNKQGVNINNLPPLNSNLSNIDLPPMSSFTNFDINNSTAPIENKKDSVFDLINQFDAISNEKGNSSLNQNNVQNSLINNSNHDQINNIPFQEVIVTQLPTNDIIKAQNSLEEPQKFNPSNILFDSQDNNSNNILFDDKDNNNNNILNNDIPTVPISTVDNNQTLTFQNKISEEIIPNSMIKNDKQNNMELVDDDNSSIFSNIPPSFGANNQNSNVNFNQINANDENNLNIEKNIPPIFAPSNENLTFNSITPTFEDSQVSQTNDSLEIKNQDSNISMFEDTEPNISQIPIDLNPNVEKQQPNVNPDNLVGNAPTILESNIANVQSNILAMDELNQNIIEDVEATNANNAKEVFNDSLAPIINDQQEENMNNYINVLNDITGEENDQNKIIENNIINDIKNKKPKKKNKRKKKIILIIIIVFLLIALSVGAVFAYFLFFKTDKLVCEYQDYSSDQFLTSETMTMNFKGRQLSDASYIENVTFTESAQAQKDEYLEELKNQFAGTDYNVSYSETDFGFQLSMNFTKENLENWIGEKINNATKDNLQSEMESSGYTCK